MKEQFLHYIWQFKKFRLHDLQTVQGEKLQVINAGQYLQLAGPDFFNAQLVIGSQKWAGNVEIHLKSSDWYHHHHEGDDAYDSVILHVVWEHDAEVFRQNNIEIPVLELKDLVDISLFENYNKLAAVKSWIFCEKELSSVDAFILDNWKERLLFERLERKAAPIASLAEKTANDWEAVLFAFLARSFGLNTNGDIFYTIAQSLPFAIIRRESFEFENIEAILFGRAGLLGESVEDTYPKELEKRYQYICTKYRLEHVHINEVQFFKHRPDNFPTIRLSQFAQLYHMHQNLFSKIISTDSLTEIHQIFKLETSAYWKNHYQFDKESPQKRKPLSASFIDLIIINTIIPFRFAYDRSRGKESSEELMQLLRQIGPEKNTIIDKFKSFNVDVGSAYDSQSLLQLKNEYCAHKRCMQCGLGLELLKR